jgi:hypothetical protein
MWRPPNPGKDGEMGRGRQKAKDAKIARQIKYGVHGADLRELERELVVGQASSSTSRAQSPSSHEPDDAPDDLDRWNTDSDDDEE